MLPADVLSRFEAVWPRETIPQRAARITAAHADRIAYIAGEHLTFAAAAARIERLAGHLARLGVGNGDIVSWQLPNVWEAPIVHQAILRAGGIPNPIGPTMREHELRAILGEARPRALVVLDRWRDFDHAGLARDLARELAIEHVLVARGGELDHLLDEPAEPPPMPEDPAALALLLYTSGTTSVPKGVLHTHRGLLTEVDSFTDIHALTGDDRALCGPPVTHIAGLAYGILAPMALGTSSVLLDRWDPARAAASLVDDAVTFMTGPPTFLLTLADEVRAAPEAFRLFSTGGATIPAGAIAAAAERLGCVVKRAYGSTEVPTLTAGRLDDDERARIDTDGSVIGAGEVRIADDGEIWARAPEMLVGYRDGRDAFDEHGWFRTGDLGALDAGGRLRVTGRLKDVIIRGGENISAPELEALLRELAAVADVAVIGVPDDRLGERACAVVVATGPLTLPMLAEHLRARGIATQKLPERLELIDRLPRSANGKVLKDVLRARFG